MVTTQIKKIIGWLFCVWIFLLPWQTAWIYSEPTINGAKWQYGTMAIYGTEIILWLIILIWATLLFKERNFLLSHWPPNKNKLFLVLSVWLLIVWAGISILWSGNRELAFYWWFKILEGGVLFFLFLNLKISWLNVARAISLAGVVQAVLAVGQFFTQAVVGNKWLGLAAQLPSTPGVAVVEAGGRWLRAYGSFSHPNILGGFLAISFLAGWLWYQRAHSYLEKLLVFIFCLIITAGLFFTFSRGAWLSLVVSLIIGLFFIFYSNRQNFLWALKLIIAAVLVFMILATIYQPIILVRVSNHTRLENKSINERLDSLAVAKEVINKNVFFGVGIGNYTWYSYQNNKNLSGYAYQPAHNLYLLIWSELGVIGFLAFLLSCFLAFLYVWRRGKIGREKLALLIALLVTGLFDHYLWTGYFGIMLWWLVLALTLKEESLD